MRFVITVAEGLDRGPQAWSQALTAIRQANTHGLPMSLCFERTGSETRLIIEIEPELRAVIEAQFYTAYPSARIDPCAETADNRGDDRHTWSASLRLVPDLWGLQQETAFIDALDRSLTDPMAGVLAMLAGTSARLHTRVRLTLTPASKRRVHQAQRRLMQFERLQSRHDEFATWWLHQCSSSKWFHRLVATLGIRFVLKMLRAKPSHEPNRNIPAAIERLHSPLFAATIQLTATGANDCEVASRLKLREIAGAFAPFVDGGQCEFVVEPSRWRVRTFLLAPSEVAALWHPPLETARPPGFRDAPFREREWPLDLPTPKTHRDVSVLGRAVFRSRSVKCGLLPDDRRRPRRSAWRSL